MLQNNWSVVFSSKEYQLVRTFVLIAILKVTFRKRVRKSIFVSLTCENGEYSLGDLMFLQTNHFLFSPTKYNGCQIISQLDFPNKTDSDPKNSRLAIEISNNSSLSKRFGTVPFMIK